MRQTTYFAVRPNQTAHETMTVHRAPCTQHAYYETDRACMRVVSARGLLPLPARGDVELMTVFSRACRAPAAGRHGLNSGSSF